MATITAQKIIEDGLTESGSTISCNASGDEFVTSGIEFLKFKNTDATTYTVTVTAQTTAVKHQTYGKLTKSNITKTVAQNQVMFMGPFKQSAFNDANGKVQITYSETPTAMTVGLFYLDPQ